MNNAWASAQAKNAQLLSGVGQTAGGMATALQGLFNQQAQQTATIINNLDTAATNALNSGATAFKAAGANIRNDVSNSVNDIAGIIKGLYGQTDQQTGKILYGLNKTAGQIAGALHSLRGGRERRRQGPRGDQDQR